MTHNVLEAERSVDRLAILDGGRVLAQGTPASLKGAGRHRRHLDLLLEPAAGPPAAPAFAEVRARVGRRLVLHLAEKDAGKAIDWARQLARNGIAESFGLSPAALEDTYLSPIGRSDVAGHEEAHHASAHAS